MTDCRYDSNTYSKFVGSIYFGYNAATGYCITNPGRIMNKCISTAYFIPPVNPAMKKTQGILTVNGVTTVCAGER